MHGASIRHQTSNTFITSSSRGLITFTVIRVNFGLLKRREVSLASWN